MAEQLVQDYRKRFDLPVMIVRPSIIGPAYAEPFAGWVDSLNGMICFVIEIGRGSLGSILLEKNAILDIVPLDIVSNFIIVAAWYGAVKP